MKRILIFILLVQFSMRYGICQEIISTSGNYNLTAGGSISWTLGEVFTETFESNQLVLTQGFYQTVLSVINIVDNTGFGSQVRVSPNPFSDHLIINMEKAVNHSYTYRLTDMYGTVIKQGELVDDVCEIPTAGIPAALYMLVIETDNIAIKKVKIIKSNNQ